MKKIITFLKWTGIVLSTLVALFFLAGLLANPSYTGSRSIVVDSSPQEVWDLLDNTERFSTSRHEVYKFEMLEENNEGHKQWREHARLWGAMNYEIKQQNPEKSLTIEMTSSDFGMSGIWEFVLIPEGAKTKVELTEKSRNEGLLMRCILATVGRDANMGLLLRVVEKQLQKGN
jgi:hypothetical protein